MGINLLIAVTDGDWFEMLRRQPDLSEVNFWAPSAANFRALQVGELFLFKLHASGMPETNLKVAVNRQGFLFCFRSLTAPFPKLSSSPLTPIRVTLRTRSEHAVNFRPLHCQGSSFYHSHSSIL